MGNMSLKEKLKLFIARLFCRHVELYVSKFIDHETHEPLKAYICLHCHKIIAIVSEDISE